MRRLALFLCAALLSAPLLASHCPQDMAKIDQLLKTDPPASSQILAEVKRLRAEGEELHNAGDHAESEKVLQQALDLLQSSE
ncbi:hypothetical protein [Pseudomonas sp. N040]|uniref:hypothetical protein n=1 Tax=Pseudomonas sp. N040 TaxID=2785325 RepID=UPI0018A316B0|nr:hypothetical protein [Pseudomonas sp. N040]MBF7730004.1 hypothetical protein [Pseudomonas sp. N040]MBW7013646.1 hypothetical protein [Pseudomonas sp. N040]